MAKKIKEKIENKKLEYIGKRFVFILILLERLQYNGAISC